VTGIPQFGLGEGVDQSGVTTKILTCNSTMDLNVDNKSKLFGLHIHTSVIQMSFGPVVFANSQGPKLYAKSHAVSTVNLYVGVKNKPMYGAGRNMQDMLKSGKGLPLIIRLRLRSNFKVVWKLINPNFHHNVECMLVLHGDLNKHRNQAYSSNCRIASTS
ncbi:delta-latroinsectotoxin-Lt1a protein, partial [Thalictrum thalictroides]